jgi:protein-S-isoprenylcysteine O-methyltransferase Ste14
VQRPASIEAPPSRSEPDRSGVTIPPPLIYVAGFLIGVALELVFPIGALPLPLALAAAFIGLALWLALDGAAMLHFRRARTSMIPMKPSTALVTSGPYRVSRNPMYVGMAVVYVALALSVGVIWALAVLPLVILAVDRLVIVREEPYLERKFGDEYREYKRRVRRWL